MTTISNHNEQCVKQNVTLMQKISQSKMNLIIGIINQIIILNTIQILIVSNCIDVVLMMHVVFDLVANANHAKDAYILGSNKILNVKHYTITSNNIQAAIKFHGVFVQIAHTTICHVSSYHCSMWKAYCVILRQLPKQ